MTTHPPGSAPPTAPPPDDFTEASDGHLRGLITPRGPAVATEDTCLWCGDLVAGSRQICDQCEADDRR